MPATFGRELTQLICELLILLLGRPFTGELCLSLLRSLIDAPDTFLQAVRGLLERVHVATDILNGFLNFRGVCAT